MEPLAPRKLRHFPKVLTRRLRFQGLTRSQIRDTENAKMIDTTRHRMIEENEKNESRSMWSGLIMSLSCEL